MIHVTFRMLNTPGYFSLSSKNKPVPATCNSKTPRADRTRECSIKQTQLAISMGPCRPSHGKSKSNP